MSLIQTLIISYAGPCVLVMVWTCINMFLARKSIRKRLKELGVFDESSEEWLKSLGNIYSNSLWNGLLWPVAMINWTYRVFKPLTWKEYIDKKD